MDWDSRGNIIEAMIETKAGENYILSNNPKSLELFELIDREVVVKALPKGKDIAGNDIIEVIDFALTKEYIKFS